MHLHLFPRLSPRDRKNKSIRSRNLIQHYSLQHESLQTGTDSDSESLEKSRYTHNGKWAQVKINAPLETHPDALLGADHGFKQKTPQARHRIGRPGAVPFQHHNTRRHYIGIAYERNNGEITHCRPDCSARLRSADMQVQERTPRTDWIQEFSTVVVRVREN